MAYSLSLVYTLLSKLPYIFRLKSKLFIKLDNLEFRYSNEDTVDYCEDCYKREGNDMILKKHLIKNKLINQ